MAVPCPAAGGTPDVALRGLQIWRSLADSAVVLRIAGDVDESNAAALTEQLTLAVAEASEVVVIELLGVTFLGSIGLTAVLECQRECARLGVALRVVAGEGKAGRTIELAGLTTVLDVYAELTRAIRRG